LPTNFDLWFNCKDKDLKQSLNWDKVANKVAKTFQFTISKPGYCTYVFDTKVPDKVFYHQEPTFSVSKKTKNGKWESVWIGFSANTTNYRGEKPKNTPNKFAYKINPDSTLKFWTIPPYYEPGTYKIDIIAAKRVGAYDLAYVQSSASLKVYFIQKGAKVTNKNKKFNKPKPGVLYYIDKKCN
jgi:hypothetical protein